jgi:hypothetical protein
MAPSAPISDICAVNARRKVGHSQWDLVATTVLRSKVANDKSAPPLSTLHQQYYDNSSNNTDND